MSRQPWFLTGLVLSALMSGVARADRISAPPPLLRSTSVTDVFRDDSRLEHRITLTAHKITVPDFLAQVEAVAEVGLSAERSAADLRVTAIIQDEPARAVLTRLGGLLQLSWRRKADGDRPAYVLYESPADLAAVQ